MTPPSAVHITARHQPATGSPSLLPLHPPQSPYSFGSAQRYQAPAGASRRSAPAGYQPFIARFFFFYQQPFIINSACAPAAAAAAAILAIAICYLATILFYYLLQLFYLIFHYYYFNSPLHWPLSPRQHATSIAAALSGLRLSSLTVFTHHRAWRSRSGAARYCALSRCCCQQVITHRSNQLLQPLLLPDRYRRPSRHRPSDHLSIWLIHHHSSSLAYRSTTTGFLLSPGRCAPIPGRVPPVLAARRIQPSQASHHVIRQDHQADHRAIAAGSKFIAAAGRQQSVKPIFFAQPAHRAIIQAIQLWHHLFRAFPGTAHLSIISPDPDAHYFIAGARALC